MSAAIVAPSDLWIGCAHATDKDAGHASPWWTRHKLVGLQNGLELRNCIFCGSTLAVEIPEGEAP